MEAIKALVCDLPMDVSYNTKGNGKAQDMEAKGKDKGKDIAIDLDHDVEDVWVVDELLFDVDSEQ